MTLGETRNGARRLNAFGRGAGGGGEAGITSVCSAHPFVVEAAMREAAAERAPLLIEATCNQVNHQGGYTGLTPGAFRDELHRTADRVGFPASAYCSAATTWDRTRGGTFPSKLR